MSTTKRWLEAESSSTSLERAVLRAGSQVTIPVGAKEQGWQRLSGATAAAAAVSLASKPAAGLVAASSATAGAKATGSIASLGFVKGVVAGVVGCVLVQGGVSRLSSHEAGEAVPAASAVSLPTVTAVSGRMAAQEATVRRDEPEIAVERRKRHPGVPQATPNVSAEPERSRVAAVGEFAPEAASSASALAKEAVLLRRARSELHGGDASAALLTLELSQRDVARPQLLQEREALLVEALARSGRRVEAGRRAREYLRIFPDSPHAGKVGALLAGER